MRQVALQFLLFVLVASPAAAEVRHVRLELVRPAEAATCPDEPAVRSAVIGRLGVDPFDASSKALLRVSLNPRPVGFAAELAITDELGVTKTRTLNGLRADCSDLREALALSLTIALEAFLATPLPPSQAPPLPPPVATHPEQPTPAKSTARVQPVTPSAQPAEPRVRTLAVGRFGGGLGVAPAPSLAIALGAGLFKSWWLVLMEARAQLPAGIPVEPGRIDVAALSAEALPCFARSVIRACGLISAGATWSWATQLDGARASVRPSFTLGARIEAGLPVSRSILLSGFVEFRAALVQSILKVGSTVVWQTPPIAGTLGLAATLTLGETDSASGDK